MTRSIHVNEDLRGVTITGSFLYIGNCILGEKNGKLTTFTGDCTGADYINNTGPADWSRADTYASVWRGNTLEGSKFPANLGYKHHEPIVEIARQGITTDITEREILDGMKAWGVSDYTNSWDTAWSDYASKIATKGEFFSAITKAFAGYRQLEVQAKYLERELQRGTLKPIPRLPPKIEIEFLDGTKATLDSQNLPALPRPQDRFELAGLIHPDLFLYSIDPPVPYVNGDEWRNYRRAGW